MQVSFATSALALLLKLVDPFEVSGDSNVVDTVSTQQGVRVRLPAASEGWTASVRDVDADRVEMHLVPPKGEPIVRTVELSSGSRETRSRELAASLVFLIEAQEPSTQDQPAPSSYVEPTADASPRRPAGWLSSGAVVLVGDPPHVAGGLAVRGGLWLAGEHVVPQLSLGWSMTARDDVTVHGIRAGAGAAFGAPLADGAWWIGGGAIPGGMWVRADGSRTRTTWVSATEAFGLAIWRRPFLSVAVRAGVDVLAPPIRVRGDEGSAQWRTVRLLAGLEFGVQLGRWR